MHRCRAVPEEAPPKSEMIAVQTAELERMRKLLLRSDSKVEALRSLGLKWKYMAQNLKKQYGVGDVEFIPDLLPFANAVLDITDPHRIVTDEVVRASQ